MGTVITTYVDDEVARALKMLARQSGVKISAITRHVLTLNMDQIRQIAAKMMAYPVNDPERLAFKETLRRVKIQHDNEKSRRQRQEQSKGETWNS